MLNVLIFSTRSLENGRGGEIFLIELAARLQKFYNITLIDTNRTFEKKKLSTKEIKHKLKGINIKDRIKFATLNILNKKFDFIYPWEIIKLHKKIKKIDIIYSPISKIKINLMFMLLCLVNRRSKFIIGFHRPLYSERIFSLYNIKYRFSILFFSLFKKRFYFHTISLHTKKFLENFYDHNKVIYIIEGLDLDNYFNKGLEKKRDDFLNFIYVGYLDDIHKGVGVLLDGIKQFLEENKNLKIFFEFCGAGPLESNLKELEQKFPQYIRYNGYVSSNILIKCYKRNDVFLFSSRREPFGRVIIEALATKLLILCSKTIGSIEILKGQDFAFFLPELTPLAIKEKILEIYNLWKENPIKIKELQMKARQFALQNYSVSKEIKEFHDLIRAIIKKTYD